MLARVTLAPFPPWLPIDAREALGSWQPRETPDELIAFRAFTVPSVTFPSFLSASSREARRSREPCAPFCSLQAEKETIWSRWSSSPWGSSESWLSISAWWAGVQCRDAWLSYEPFGAHFTR